MRARLDYWHHSPLLLVGSSVSLVLLFLLSSGVLCLPTLFSVASALSSVWYFLVFPLEFPLSAFCCMHFAFCILYFVQCKLIIKAHSCGAACLPLGLHLGPFEMNGDKHTSNYRHIEPVRSHNRADSIAWVSGSCKMMLTLFHVHKFFQL